MGVTSVSDAVREVSLKEVQNITNLFKNRVINFVMTEKKCYNLIKRDWDETQSLFLSQGIQWYPIENEYCRDIANKHNRDIITVSGLFAVFSPIKSVREIRIY